MMYMVNLILGRVDRLGDVLNQPVEPGSGLRSGASVGTDDLRRYHITDDHANCPSELRAHSRPFAFSDLAPSYGCANAAPELVPDALAVNNAHYRRR